MCQVIKKHILEEYTGCIVKFCIIIWESSIFRKKSSKSAQNAGLPNDNAKLDNTINIPFKDVFFSDLAHLGKL